MQHKYLINEFGQLYTEQLNINLKKKVGNNKEIFKWFLAAILFGHRISESIAIRSYQAFAQAGLLTPEAILKAGWDKLVKVLDSGGYARYDFSTADRLLEICTQIQTKYHGSLNNLHRKAKNNEDLENLLKEFKGVGSITANIFLREMRLIWVKADPEPTSKIQEVAKKLQINLKNMDRKTESFMRLECALIRMRKNSKNHLSQASISKG